MTDESGGVSRRAFILSTAGAGAIGATGAAVGQENNNTTAEGDTQPGGGGNTSAGEGGNESEGNATGGEDTGDGDGGASGQPDYGGWLDDVDNHDGSTADERGSDEVTIEVGTEGNGGALAFDPPAVWVDTGTTVVWEWTGEGGGHNVHAMEGADFSSSTQTSGTYEQTLEEGGIVAYQCDPHASLGMKGAVAVGDDVPTKSSGGGGGGGSGVPQIPNSAKTLGIASTMALGSTLGLAYFFMKYGGDYHE